MVVKVYGMDISAPTRCVMMTCEVLEVEYEFHVVNLMNEEHMKPEYLKVFSIYDEVFILLYCWIEGSVSL